MKAADAAHPPHDPPCTLLRGGVSERPKERASKARVGATSPWVQIPPPPPFDEKCLARGVFSACCPLATPVAGEDFRNEPPTSDLKG